MAHNSETESLSRKFVLASRASQLAQIQTNMVVAELQSLYPPPTDSDRNHQGFTFGTSFMSTAGDKNQSQALYLLGGKALWTNELEVALENEEVDMVVHCLKDVPTTLSSEKCTIAAILKREDPVDSLVVKAGAPWKSLKDLPEGSVIGTSSVRRVAQLRKNFPTLKFLDVRGNLNTRLAKLDAPDGPYHALVLAKAGLVRLGMGSRITADLQPPTLYHAVSQGALAIEIRSGDSKAYALCRQLTHWETEWMCLAERACLRVLEGGCSVPIGVASKLEDLDDGKNKAGTLTLTGSVTAISGHVQVEHTIQVKVKSDTDCEEAGKTLAEMLLGMGARKILDDVKKDRDQRAAEADKNTT